MIQKEDFNSLTMVGAKDSKIGASLTIATLLLCQYLVKP